MLTIELPKSIEDRLTAIAKQRGTSPSVCAQEAIVQLLEDQDDLEAALSRIDRLGRRWTLEELEQGRDLEG